jgi:hypothetical protein
MFGPLLCYVYATGSDCNGLGSKGLPPLSGSFREGDIFALTGRVSAPFDLRIFGFRDPFTAVEQRYLAVSANTGVAQ